MKRTMWIVAGLAVLALCSVSCINALLEYWTAAPYYAIYFVKNTTDNTIAVDKGTRWGYYSVEPGDSVDIAIVEVRRNKGYPDFHSLSKSDIGSVSVSVPEKDGAVLKVWTNDGADEPGRQFFNESFWRYYIREYNDDPDYFIWVFDILPEDMGPVTD